MKLFEIFGEIALKGAEAVNKGLAEVDKNGAATAKALSAMGDSVAKTGDSMSKWVSGPILAVTAALGATVKSVVDLGSNLVDTATRTGMSVESFQELSFALSQITGASEGAITSAFQRINQRVGEAAQGNKNYTASLQDLGFTQQQISSGTLKSDEVFAALSRRLQSTKSDAEAAALAGAFLGAKLGQTLAPALRAGGEEVDNLRQKFRDLGLGMSNESAASAEALGDKLDVLGRQFQALLIPIGTALLPLLEQLVVIAQTSLIPALQQVVGVVATVVGGFAALPAPLQQAIIAFGAFGVALGPVLSIVGRVLTVLGGMPTVIGAVVTVFASLAPAVAGVSGAFTTLVPILAGFALPVAAAVAAVGAAILIFENWDAIVLAVSDTYEALVNTITTFSNQVLPVLTAWGQKVVDFYTGLWKAIIDSVASWGKSVVTGITNMATSAWGVLKNWGTQVITFFTDLPKRVIASINNMVQTVVNSVTQMAQRTIAAIQDMYRQVVGNSIVPDMVDEVGAEMSRMTREGVAEAEKFNVGVQGALENTAAGTTASVTGAGRSANNGAASGNGNTYVDMRHAVIRDSMDMTDRLNRNGGILAGAF